MTTNDIDAIRDLVNATEPGPWVTESNGKGGVWINLPAYPHAWGMHGFPDEAEFAAAARTLVPALCDEIEQLRAELAKEIDLKERYARTAASLVRQRDNHAAQADRFAAELAAERARTQETHQ